MPSSLYVPILIAGMLITVRPFLLLFRGPTSLLLRALLLTISIISTPGLQQLPMVKMAGTCALSLLLPCSHARASDAHTRPQDMQCVENCTDPNPRNHVLYEQPVWQTLQMFCTCHVALRPVPTAHV